MMWTALVGKYQYEEQYKSNPIANQYAQDLISLNKFDETWWLAESIQKRYEQRQGQALRILFEDQDAVTELLNFDTRTLKAYDLRHNMVPPPSEWSFNNDGDYDSCLLEDNTVEIQDEDKLFTCNWTVDDGNPCIYKCSTIQGLKMHQMTAAIHQNNDKDTLTKLVLNNQCPKCGTALSSYRAAHRHLTSALLRGYCKANTALMDHEAQKCVSPQCVICGTQHKTMEEYIQHCRSTHLGHIQIIKRKEEALENSAMGDNGSTQNESMSKSTHGMSNTSLGTEAFGRTETTHPTQLLLTMKVTIKRKHKTTLKDR